LWICSSLARRFGAQGSVARADIRIGALALLVLDGWYLARAADARTAPLHLIAIAAAAAVAASLVARIPTWALV
jgi:hypothetical protein